jgi:hypothetical protein
VRAVDVQPELALVTERADCLSSSKEPVAVEPAVATTAITRRPCAAGESAHRERLGVHAPIARRDDDGVVQAG